MGYERRADGKIVKVNRRTRLKKPKGRRAELLVLPAAASHSEAPAPTGSASARG